MPDSGMSLAEECFREHLARFDFVEGVELGKWGVHEDAAVLWPNVVIWVSAAPRPNAPSRYYLLFDLAHYPKAGPTAYVWDPSNRTKLETAKWPKGSGDVGKVFRIDWENAAALYAPWDRFPTSSHPDWPGSHPGLVWAPGHTIVNYLRPTHALLNSNEYQGV